MEFKNLIIRKEDRVGILSINRPDALNALNWETLDELDRAVDIVIADEDIHILVITGEGRAFVAGADISEMAKLDVLGGREFAEKGIGILRKIELMEKPVIAAINGFALGGGSELALACDMRVASTKAKIGQPEVSLGITPGFGASQRLSRLVGISKAKELIFTGDVLDAQEAHRIGLVNKVVSEDKLMDEVLAIARKIASNSQIAVRLSKTAINRGMDTDMDTGMDLEKHVFALCFGTEDQKEGMRAFLERRDADFKLK